MQDVYIKIRNASNMMHTQPTRQISCNIKQQKSIYYGVSGSWWKLHWRRANEKQVGRINGKVLPSIMETIDSHWSYSTKNTSPQQWSIRGIESRIQKNYTIQLVPSNNHSHNSAKRAIQTFKSHFKAVLAGVDDSFPMRLWDKFLPQTILMLKLLRQSNVPPTVSTYQYVDGNFDYNKMPLPSMGCAVQLHKSTNRRGTWAEHLTGGW